VKLSWSGSAITFRFTGTEAAVRMDDAARFFTLLVDGVEQPRLETSPGEQSYALASGLADATHEVWLHRRTEASFGETRFLGVELGSGTLLAPPPAAARRIEVIGDSITCGYGNEGADQYCNFSADTENHWLTYGAIAARNLGAELVTVAWSGKGIVYNYGDDKNEPLPALYDRAIATQSTGSWDFSAWQPHAVVVNLGTNDYSTDGDPSAALFSSEYEAFLAHLRSKNPDAYILCLVPTLLGGTDLTDAERDSDGGRGAPPATNSKPFAEFQQTAGVRWHRARPPSAMGALTSASGRAW
jgi:lysophospholipase L1-like esterase